MNALRIVLPLGVAAIIAGLYIGNSSPALDVYRGSHHDGVCQRLKDILF
jgi:hypothetical protein